MYTRLIDPGTSESGKQLPNKPLVGTAVPLSAKGEKAGVALKKPSKNLSLVSEKEVFLGELPKEACLDAAIEIDKIVSAAGQETEARKPAREWLSVVLDEMEASQSYELLHEPSKGRFVLHLRDKEER